MKGRGGYDIRLRRRREIEALAQDNGAAETDDYPRYLVLWAQALPENADRMIGILRNASRRMGHEITEDEARDIIEEARSTSRPRTPDGWARALGLTYARRQRIGITTIGAIDVTKRQRARLRKLRKRERHRQRRQALGATPRTQSLSTLKPWAAESISRRTWERRRRADANSNPAIGRDANSNPALLLSLARNCVNVVREHPRRAVMARAGTTRHISPCPERRTGCTRVRRPRLPGA
jgi:hypothetical protein